MSIVVEKLAAAGHITQKQADDVRARAKAFVKEAQRDPKLMEAAMVKLGLAKEGGILGDVWKGFKSAYPGAKSLAAGATQAPTGVAHGVGRSMGQILPPTLASAAIVGGFGVGTEAGRSIIGGVRGHIQKARGYQKMMDSNPGLQEYDSERVQQAFNTLHKFNPEYASDPLVAGTFVSTAVDQARMDTGTVNQIVQARRGMAQPDRAANFFRMLPKTQMHDPNLEAQRATEHGMKVEEHDRRQDIHPQEMETARQRSIKATEEAARADVQREEAESEAGYNEEMRERMRLNP